MSLGFFILISLLIANFFSVVGAPEATRNNLCSYLIIQGFIKRGVGVFRVSSLLVANFFSAFLGPQKPPETTSEHAKCQTFPAPMHPFSHSHRI